MIKKTILIFTIFFNLICFCQNSALSEDLWYQFSIDKSGVYKIDKNFLQQLGIDINNINPNYIKIYGNGGNMLSEPCSEIEYYDPQENAIYISGEQDGVFNNDDYILFYGQGPHGWNADTALATAEHQQNIYSDSTSYFLSIGSSEGKRISNKNNQNQTANIIISEYDDYVFYEEENVNLLSLGRLWFGDDFSLENNQNFSLPFSNTTSNITIKVSAVCESTTANTNMTISANNQDLGIISFSGSTSGENIWHKTISSEITITEDIIELDITFNNNGNPSANAYLDFIEIYGKRNLIANGSQFAFRSFDSANTSETVEFQIQNNENIFQVWDITNHISPSIVTNNNNGSLFSFTDNSNQLNEYIVLSEDDFYTPTQVDESTIENQNLKSLINTQYIVITTSELSTEAQRLANYHQENSNLTTSVVELDKIYNEFSSGNPDITAIRNFIKYLYDNSSDDSKLEYVCFLGDTSYDYKNRISDNTLIVPAYYSENSFNTTFSYVTDDYFAMISEEDGDMSSTDDLDISTGRIPVTNASEAKIIIDKTLNYYSTASYGSWKNNITLVADDIDFTFDTEIQSDLEEIADLIKANQPKFNIKKIYADAYLQESSSGGERYSNVNEDITNSMENGTLVLNYYGHGGEDGLATERILTLDMIKGFSNFNTLPLFITVTCEFSKFDNPLRDTGGEELLLNADGGSASMISTTRAITITQGALFNERLAKYIFSFDNNDDSIAKNVLKTKNETSTSQRYFIYYFGDPAMKLGIPKPNIAITEINDVDISQANDTLKALSKISLKGIVTDNNNNILTDYNGTLYSTIYDKETLSETLDNDNFGIVNTFDVQESKIFNGKASITNGAFNFDFVVPKDIKTAYGNGKISFYAENQSLEKGGANFDIIVGGIDENAPTDVTGPEIQAFLNDESFIDGGNTNSSPNLIIKLFDANGINTSISSVDHDIVAVLDGNEIEPIILNDYYETELDDYTNGNVNYQLRDLSTGYHTLKIKAWDTYNNSSETTLNFLVIDDSIIQIENVLNYPNPFVSYTEFWFTHNKPNIPLDVQLQIFTVSGKLIKTINQSVQTTGSLSRTINWNGLDDFGNKIGKGVYVYKLKVNSESENLSIEKYEKLVIL